MTYNSGADLLRFWSEFEPAWAEWIVVDNGSIDDSVEIAERLGARVVASQDNLGFSRANNLGAADASGAVLLFCNPDVRVTENGINQLARSASRGEAIIAPQLLNSDGSLQENGRGTPFPHRKIAHMFFKGLSDRGRYSKVAQPEAVIEVVWVMGAALALTRSAFNQIKGWEDRYFLYYEDSDICIRARLAGIPSYVDGNVRWVHGWARETSRGFSLDVWRREFRSAWLFYRLHPYCIVPLGKRARRLAAVDRLEA